jgi:hypothetical protein
MKKINVVDNFLSENELHFVSDFFYQRAEWKYGHTDTSLTSIRWFKCNLNEEPFFTKYLLSKISKFTNQNWKILDAYANGQTILLQGETHTDCLPQDDDEWTALLYVSDIGSENVDTINGHTEFKINNETKCVEPFKNRLVFFKGDIPHKGNAPSIPEMFRISVVLKLKRKI